MHVTIVCANTWRYQCIIGLWSEYDILLLQKMNTLHFYFTNHFVINRFHDFDFLWLYQKSTAQNVMRFSLFFSFASTFAKRNNVFAIETACTSLTSSTTHSAHCTARYILHPFSLLKTVFSPFEALCLHAKPCLLDTFLPERAFYLAQNLCLQSIICVRSPFSLK